MNKKCTNAELKDICMYYDEGKCRDGHSKERSCEEGLRAYRGKIFKKIEKELIKKVND